MAARPKTAAAKNPHAAALDVALRNSTVPAVSRAAAILRLLGRSSEPMGVQAIARALNRRAPIALRVNPDVDAKTHPYISTGLKKNKFGVDIATAERLYAEAARLAGIEIVGVASHIGSQLLELSPFLDALERVLAHPKRVLAGAAALPASAEQLPPAAVVPRKGGRPVAIS